MLKRMAEMSPRHDQTAEFGTKKTSTPCLVKGSLPEINCIACDNTIQPT
jgi:hypothetical protein